MSLDIIKQELIEDKNHEAINASLTQNPFKVQVKQEDIVVGRKKCENSSYSSTELQVNSHNNEQYDDSDKSKEDKNTRNYVGRKKSYDSDFNAMHTCPFLDIIRKHKSGTHMEPYIEDTSRSPLAVFLQSRVAFSQGFSNLDNSQSKYEPDDGCRFNIQWLAKSSDNLLY
eukprot:TRINITY_DN3130_c1_g1_i5.p1 TRINITY_DN3130_c1_g1~~TRINITY_DN3130_c1_g1_i5.p1  ORF type:complete len:170 (-),score=10.77 TRINITY_DN3130_c1_g1_i5:140-649(-)